MISWSQCVPLEARKKTYGLRRCPTSGKLAGICTVENLIGCYTHWYGGKTVPCESPDCKPCKEGVPKRWHSYVAAFNPKINQEFIFECTGQGAEYFEAYQKVTGTLIGCHFVAERVGTKQNGRVIITCKPFDLTSVRLPEPLDVISVLSTIWQLPLSSMKANGNGRIRKSFTVDSDTAGVMNDPILEKERRRKRS